MTRRSIGTRFVATHIRLMKTRLTASLVASVLTGGSGIVVPATSAPMAFPSLVMDAVEFVIAMPMPRVVDEAKGRGGPENSPISFLTAYANVCGPWWFGLGIFEFH